MANINTELYFDPVSQVTCEVLSCSNAAKYRKLGAGNNREARVYPA
jgi:hypothetical protein